MGTTKKFLVVKNKDEKLIKYFEYEKLKGYKITPNKNVKFEDAINVDTMILISPSLIEKMVEKKVKRKLTYLINMMSYICDSDDDNNTADGLFFALNEVEKFRNELYNKYKNYIKEEKMMLLDKKVAILEDELKLRLRYISAYSMEQSEYSSGKRSR